MRHRKLSYARRLPIGFFLGVASDIIFAAPWQKSQIDWSAFVDTALGTGVVGARIGAGAIWITNRRLARRAEPWGKLTINPQTDPLPPFFAGASRTATGSYLDSFVTAGFVAVGPLSWP